MTNSIHIPSILVSTLVITVELFATIKKSSEEIKVIAIKKVRISPKFTPTGTKLEKLVNPQTKYNVNCAYEFTYEFWAYH